MVESVEKSIQRTRRVAEALPLIEKLRGLASNQRFWTQRRDGLAVLASPTEFYAFDVRPPVPTAAIVADSFHLKPLLRTVQSADRFHVLCLQRDKIRLYEGSRDELVELKPAAVPRTVVEALGDEVVVQRKTMTAAGKSGEPRPAPRAPGVPPGHPAKGDDAKLDAEHFFRVVDEAILTHVSRPSGLPLLVTALPEDWARFRDLSGNPQLLKVAIERSPAALTEQPLLSEAWKCIEPYYLARLEKLIEQYRIGKARGLVSDDLLEVRGAAHEGRVGVLLIEADDDIAGEGARASVVQEGDDPLDDLAELILRQKGTVVIVPPDRMPTTTGLAATYRF